MAFQHGRTQNFQITDSGSVNRDISAYITDVKFPESVALHDVTVLGAVAKSFYPGLRDAKITLTGIYDPTVTTAIDAVLQPLIGVTTASTWIYGPYGTTAGFVKYTGSGFIESYEVGASVADVVKWTGVLQMHGNVTRTTF
jgi:hypothetical protein